MNAALRVRAHTAADAPAMLHMIRAAFAEYRGVLDPPSSAERKDLGVLRAELAEGGALVAERDGQLVGCVLHQRRGEDLHVGRLSVLPEHRGGGIGAALMEAVEAVARVQGLAGVTLSVRLPLEHQQRWYARRGYAGVRLGTHDGYRAPTQLLMRKRLREEAG